MKRAPILLLALLLATLAAIGPGLKAAANNTAFDIRGFGAVGDGSTLNTAAIQKAIDACTAAGGGEVVIAGGKFVTGTIYLKDNVTLHVAPGAALLGSTNIADYATDTHRNMYAGEAHMDRCLIFARGAKNIGIVGSGTIDGRGSKENFPNRGDRQRNRPMLLRFLECTKLRLRDVTLLAPAAWTSAWLYCDDVVVDGVTIQSRANGNGDGLDFDGCRNVRVSNCSFDTSDDSICLQSSRADRPCRDVVIANCVFTSKWAGIRIGLLSVGDFENVTVSNCVFRDITDAGLKIQLCEGGTMRNMVFANLVMQNVPRPVFMTFNRWRMGVDTPTETPPMKVMRDMQFQNIRVDNSELAGMPCGIVLSGAPGHCIENIAFDNVSLTLPGGGTNQEAIVRDLPTFVEQRPEFGVLGKTIPFAGFYARHVRGLSLNNVRISAARAEARPAVMCDDVQDLAVAGAKFSDTFSGSEIIYLRDVQQALIRNCRAGRGATLVREEAPKNRKVEVLPAGQQTRNNSDETLSISHPPRPTLTPVAALRAADSGPTVTPRAETALSSHAADWLHDARLGVFMHFFTGTTKDLALVDSFDVTAVARQLKEMGAAYCVLTLGQNLGFYNSPNSVFDRFLGCGPGERCSRRDLPLDLHRALQAEGIRLMLYLPCQTPNRDARAQRAFGLSVGNGDQPINEEFARKWAQVIHEWSARYGDKVAGWWFDGGYQRIQFNDAIAAIYADAVKRGNPRAIVTFNPGVKLVRHTKAEDYTAGELNDPFKVLPATRWVDGSQWHALTFLGSRWGRRDIRHPTEDWIKWVSAVTEKGGVVTLDLGPNKNAATGLIGTFSSEQVTQFKAIQQALPTKDGYRTIKVSP